MPEAPRPKNNHRLVVGNSFPGYPIDELAILELELSIFHRFPPGMTEE